MSANATVNEASLPARQQRTAESRRQKAEAESRKQKVFRFWFLDFGKNFGRKQKAESSKQQAADWGMLPLTKC